MLITTLEQIPAIDKATTRLDKRIGKAQVTIAKCEERIRVLLRRIERVKRYSRELGRQKAVAATFQLDL